MTVTLQSLLDELRQPDARRRMRAAYVLGTVDEVDALDALTEAYRAESDTEAKEAILWAGRRLRALHAEGYTTLEAIIAQFHLLDSMNDDAEQRIIDEYKLRTQQDAIDQHGRNMAARKIGKALVQPAIFSAMDFLTSPLQGRKLAADVDALGAQDFSQSRPRVKPVRPGEGDIRPQLAALKAATEPRERIDRIFDLAQTHNNPAALPHLAAIYALDSDDAVREAAQRAARVIYWNALYWQMEQDGSMAAELARRAAAMGEPQAQADTAKDAQASADDIAEALRKAEEARQRRQKK
jgi:hypothetical protein